MTEHTEWAVRYRDGSISRVWRRRTKADEELAWRQRQAAHVDDAVKWLGGAKLVTRTVDVGEWEETK